MKYYKDVVKKYAGELIPEAWVKAVAIEKKTELLIYYMMHKCIEQMDSVYILLEKGDKMQNVIKSWLNDETNTFGKHAFFAKVDEEGNMILGINYNMYQISEDLDSMARDQFGTLDQEVTGEAAIDGDYEFSEQELKDLYKRVRIQKSSSKNA